MQQRKNILDRGLSNLILIFLILVFFFSQSSHAENMSQLYGYIANLGSVKQDDSGAVTLPPAVLSGMAGGRVSPILQLTLTQHIMNSCVKNVLTKVPERKDPYLKNAKAFNDGICKLNKCFQTGMVVSMLPQLSSNKGFGGSSSSSSRDGSLQMMLAMMSSFKKSDSRCGNGDKDGFDPMLMLLLTKAKGS